MANGDVKNAAVWANADVFIGGMDAKTPKDSDDKPDGSDFDDDWDAVGLLKGDDGFTESMENDSSDAFAWGGMLIATTRKEFKLTRKFTAFEDNETVMDLVYPGSDLDWDDDGHGYAGRLKTPDLQHKFKIAFETRTGDDIKRVVTSNYAQVDERGDLEENEDDPQSREITVAIYPDSDGYLFDTYKGKKKDADDSGGSDS